MSKRSAGRGARFNAGRRRVIKGMAATGALDLQSPPQLDAPAFSALIGPFGSACGLPAARAR